MSTYIRLFLSLLLILVSIAAFGGGVAMMLGALYPERDMMKMSLSLLEPIPFINSWFIPGLLLFCLNGIGSGWAAWICLKCGNQGAGKAGLMMGSILCIWIIVQVILIGYVSILQSIFGIIGLVEIIVAILLLKINTLSHEF